MITKIVLRVARTADLPAIRELVTTEFVQSEPATKHLRSKKAAFAKVYDQYAAHIDLKTTIVAEESNEQQPAKLVSCHVTIPLSAAVDLGGFTEHMPIIKLLDQLSLPLGEVLKKKSIPESRVLHSMLGATRQEYQGKGLYKEIVAMLTQEVLKDPRWDMAVSECTSPATQHIKKNNFGWTEENFIFYDNFEIKGQRPFKGLDGGVALMWKDYRDMKRML